MRLVLHDGVGWKVQDSSQSVSDPGRRRLVIGRSVPDGQDVLLTDRQMETVRLLISLIDSSSLLLG